MIPSIRIFIIGMPGAGKTTLGRSLASLYQCDFTDLDDRIVESHGPIPEIFRNAGEDTFRRYEHEALLEVCGESPGVIATGGGAPCFHNNLEIMKEHGVVVFVNTPLEILSERLSKNTGRPLIDNESSVVSRLQNLWDSRQQFYLKADLRVGETSPEEIKKRIDQYVQSASE